jgi:hypothetical protein
MKVKAPFFFVDGQKAIGMHVRPSRELERVEFGPSPRKDVLLLFSRTPGKPILEAHIVFSKHYPQGIQ